MNTYGIDYLSARVSLNNEVRKVTFFKSAKQGKRLLVFWVIRWHLVKKQIDFMDILLVKDFTKGYISTYRPRITGLLKRLTERGFNRVQHFNKWNNVKQSLFYSISTENINKILKMSSDNSNL